MRQLSNHQVEILRQVENAAMLRDLEHVPGWIVYKELAHAKIQALRDISEDANTDKEASWAAKLRLQAVKEFQKCMEELVSQAKDLLEPQAMQRMIESVNPHEDVFTGELNLTE